ncbi:MAG: methyltransferase domain-containing protein, partial [Candidatus Magasanikbacteria bacterium]|nr:methyltransferase domain-containing protein [Candidatus Magasanikbacteria bacterium]
MDAFPILHCFACKSKLEKKDQTLFCSTCKKQVIEKEGVWLFTEERYWGEVEESEMVGWLEAIKSKNYPDFKEAFYKGNAEFFNFTYEKTRADWVTCVSVLKDWRVLDIGAGMGNMAFVLSELAGEVYTLDKSWLRARFVHERIKKEGKENIWVAVGDALALPFPDNTFDMVSGNGLFEWLGVTDKFANPTDAQLHFLKEVKRVLKPGGYVYVGIENRVGAPLFFGGIDHSGLQYTSLMPRKMADWYTKRKTGKAYQMYTYTRAGYEKHFKSAGLVDIEFFLPLPGYNLPKYV